MTEPLRHDYLWDGSGTDADVECLEDLLSIRAEQ